MARFARAVDNEPLMKLERPTPASSQTTAHLINSCFSDVLSAKPHDPKAVNNLAVSRRGESDYHDTFVDKLKEVTDTFTQRLNLLSQLERHLVQARAKALSDDEKAIALLSESCPTYDELDLPRGPSQFRKYLNEDLFNSNHLLVPSQYTYAKSEQNESSQAIASSPPSYLKPTHSAQQHAYRPENMVNMTLSSTDKHKKPIWQNSLSVSEREAEKVGLSKLNQKAKYLRNSRYSKGSLTNTASSGPIKLKQTEQGSITADNRALPSSFVIDPSVVQFTRYRGGGSYKATFELRNTSHASRQLRIFPLMSPYFKVSPTLSSVALIAPGLSLSFMVTFTPDCQANYEEEFKIMACNDERITVPLRGFRPAPILSLPSILEAGYCLAGCERRCTIECINTGGEGNFRLDKLEMSDDGEETSICSILHLGPFTLSPREFYLPANEGRVEIMISFVPGREGVREYLEKFNMACDNGQVLTFTVRGVTEKVDVGCVFIGAGKMSAQAQSLSRLMTDHNEGSDLIAVGTDSQHMSHDRVIVTPSLTFDPVNPSNKCSGVIVVKNFSNTELPYKWVFYRPITEPPSSIRDRNEVPLMKQLAVSVQTPFSVNSTAGTLLARESKSITFNFTPKQVGCFVDMAHLVVSGIHSNKCLDSSAENTRWLRLSQTEVAVLCVELCGTSLDFNMSILPPALVFAHQLPLATETKEQVKLFNNSLAPVCYQWDRLVCDVAHVTVDPPHGYIEPGGDGIFQVVIASKSKGHFSTDLCCRLENCDKVIHFPISGDVQAPLVSVSCPCLEFGLLAVGRRGSLSFRITSHSNCTLLYTVKQLVQGDREGFIDTECLTFDPSTGQLAPCGSVSVVVDCISVGAMGKLRTVIEVHINGEPIIHFWALGDFQRPEVSLDPCQLHMDKCYLGIEATETVTLQNSSHVAAQFSWSSHVAGEDGRDVRVCVSPMTGRIGGMEAVEITIGTIWKTMGPHSAAVIQCKVLDMEPPLYLRLSSQVSGLSVSYAVQHADCPTGIETPNNDGLCLDFGSNNKLGVPVGLSLTVTNTSGIPASLEASIAHFPAATSPAPPTLPKPGVAVRPRRVLLNNTTSLTDRSTHQASADHSSSLLRGGHGCCFLIDTPSLPLPPFTSVVMSLTAYSDLWGEYTDKLVCEVPGMEDTIIPVRYGVIGCPIIFQTTATYGHTLARLGSHAPGNRPVKRGLKMKNTSPVALRVDWQMFNVVQDDNQYVDLVTFIGEQLPRTPGLLQSLPTDTSPLDAILKSPEQSNKLVKFNMASKSESSMQLPEHQVIVERRVVARSEIRLEDISTSDDNTATIFTSDLITTLTRPHEGIQSNDPFNILPKQIIIPGHGISYAEITFTPSLQALTEMGHDLASYALGFLSLEEASSPNVLRCSGYDVDPVRIDILANIDQAQLLLQCDEDSGLVFSYPASLLLESGATELLETCQLTHHYTLVNLTALVVEFQLSTLTKYFKLTKTSHKKGHDQLSKEQYLELKPRESVKFDVCFTLALNDMRDAYNRAASGRANDNDRSYSLEDSVQVNFSSGAVQVFPLVANVSLPILSLSAQEIDFGITHIGSRPRSVLLNISNTSASNAVWKMEVSADLRDVVTVLPPSGFLPTNLTGGKSSTQQVRVDFTPSRECDYSGFIYLTERITLAELTLKVSGQGSADEKYIFSY